MDGLRLPGPIAGNFDPRPRLAALLQARNAQRDALRGDDLDQRFAHFSDLAFCLHATHARRSGLFRFTPSDDQALIFALGFAFEDWAAAALGDEPLRHAQDVVYALPAAGDVTFGVVPHERFGEVREELLAQNAVIGHPDFVLTARGLVIDTKTTTFIVREGERQEPVAAKPSDLMQTAGYAVALDALAAVTGRPFPAFAIWTGDKAAGGQGFVTYRTADFAALVRHGLRDLIDATSPAAAAPAARPPLYTEKHIERGPRKGQVTSWLCRRCSYLACPRNESSQEA